MWKKSNEKYYRVSSHKLNAWVSVCLFKEFPCVQTSKLVVMIAY